MMTGIRSAAYQQKGNGFYTIADNFKSIDQVQKELRRQGLESSQLIVAVDFTKSNTWQGANSFHGKHLHEIGCEPNPYEEAITLIGKTLHAFDSDGLIHAYGFGDATTGDHSVFSFYPNDQRCNGLEEVLQRYRELAPHVRLDGPTSFAPAIRRAMDVVVESGGGYHTLLIIADGHVSGTEVSFGGGQLSPHEQETVDAIVEASNYPLSIVMVGVGDGPWDKMEEFDDRLPQRKFDNFQFVNFTQLSQRTFQQQAHREAAFALAALMEIPEQYQAIQRLRLLGNRRLPHKNTRPLDPPFVPPATTYLPQEHTFPLHSSFPPPGLGHGAFPAASQSPPSQHNLSHSAYPLSQSHPRVKARDRIAPSAPPLPLPSSVPSSFSFSFSDAAQQLAPTSTTSRPPAYSYNRKRPSTALAPVPVAGRCVVAGGTHVSSGWTTTSTSLTNSSFTNSSLTNASYPPSTSYRPSTSHRPSNSATNTSYLQSTSHHDQNTASFTPTLMPRQQVDDRYRILQCPINLEVMNEPVIAADGHTYERSAIENWLRKSNTSPMTNQRLEHTMLIPNHAVKAMIQEAR